MCQAMADTFQRLSQPICTCPVAEEDTVAWRPQEAVQEPRSQPLGVHATVSSSILLLQCPRRNYGVSGTLGEKRLTFPRARCGFYSEARRLCASVPGH